MALRTYDGILDLFKKGAVVEAQEQFTALHGKALLRQQKSFTCHGHNYASESELGGKGQPKSNGIAYYCVENGKKSGPFCQRCYDTKSRLEKLRPLDAATYICFACKMECERNLCG